MHALQLFGATVLETFLVAAKAAYDGGTNMRLSTAAAGGLDPSEVALVNSADNITFLTDKTGTELFETSPVCFKEQCVALPHMRKQGFLKKDSPSSVEQLLLCSAIIISGPYQFCEKPVEFKCQFTRKFEGACQPTKSRATETDQHRFEGHHVWVAGSDGQVQKHKFYLSADERRQLVRSVYTWEERILEALQGNVYYMLYLAVFNAICVCLAVMAMAKRCWRMGRSRWDKRQQRIAEEKRKIREEEINVKINLITGGQNRVRGRKPPTPIY